MAVKYQQLNVDTFFKANEPISQCLHDLNAQKNEALNCKSKYTTPEFSSGAHVVCNVNQTRELPNRDKNSQRIQKAVMQ